MSNFQRIAKIGYHILIWKFTLLTIIVYGRPVFMAFVGNPFPRIYIPTNLYTIILLNTYVKLRPHEHWPPWLKMIPQYLLVQYIYSIYKIEIEERKEWTPIKRKLWSIGFDMDYVSMTTRPW